MQNAFAYRAIGADGTIGRGTLDVESALEARRVLIARGLLPIELTIAAARRERRDVLSAADLALGLRVLADLLDSGLSVGRALHAFEDLAPRAWYRALPHIRQSVREGKSLASALATAPIAIPALVIGIAKAGEAGQGIGPAIRRAAELSEASAETRAAVRSALAYPMVVAAAGVGAIILLITVVLPRFAAILADLGQTLPASTQLVLRASAVARVALLPATGMIALAFIIWRAWVNTEIGRTRWHNWLLQLPLIGNVRLGLGTARMAQSLAALLENGVPIANALLLSARATGDGELECRVLAARQRIGAGTTISRAIEEMRAATLTTVRLIRAGEESGRVPSMLAHAARIEQQRVDRIVRTAVRMLEPILLLTFASAVAFVAAALLQAIYSVRPSA